MTNENPGPEDTVEISCIIQNIGSVAGDEVVQLYFHDDSASMVRPAIELGGFHRVSLLPGESKKVIFSFHSDQTAFIGKDGTWVLEPGGIHILIGSSCSDIRLKTTLTIGGDAHQISPHRHYCSESALMP